MTGQTADGWQWCRRPGAVMHYPNRAALNTDLSLMTSKLLFRHNGRKSPFFRTLSIKPAFAVPASAQDAPFDLEDRLKE
ncbi:hypothetical protein CKA34_31140 (plasmid) [Rhizobium sp. 11515TR]|jgi:hypothetical protein|nr:hypothetical protein CKA34_31140 [Rhizobium sp. 11515TR]